MDSLIKKQFYYSSQQVGLSASELLFVQELAIALRESLSKSAFAANNDCSSVFHCLIIPYTYYKGGKIESFVLHIV